MAENAPPRAPRRCVVVMYDTLCRHFMPTYGNEWIIAPNFERLAKLSVQFNNMYVGSMPCMPARREMHTGRHNFLHRSWGPLEPFDDSMPQRLKRNGVHSHKVTDHHHYWEDGGATYHTRFKTFDFVRGQEGDWWKGDVDALNDTSAWGVLPGGPANEAEAAAVPARWPESQRLLKMRQDNINRQYMPTSDDLPQHHTFSLGLDFIERNVRAKGDWYIQIETFDPHEPFFTKQEFRDLYPHEYDGPEFDWPPYREVREDDQTVEHMRYMYAALVTFCDMQLGRVLDVFDKYDMWKDTMLIVNTDHGFLMGEHDWWAKVINPFFQEVAHIPFWVYDPRLMHGDRVHDGLAGAQRESLATTVDICPTVLDYFGIGPTPNNQGFPLTSRMLSDEPVRAATIYGVFGGQVNVTDGRFVYMRGPASWENQPLNEYTLMPTHMMSRFHPRELQDWERHDGFAFTKGCKLMQIPARSRSMRKGTASGNARMATLLFDVAADPGQTKPLFDAATEARMIGLMVDAMAFNDAPLEQYTRLGLPTPAALAADRAAACAAACVLQSEQGRRWAAEGAGSGFPKGTFSNSATFPDNLRLRAGYQFSRDPDAPKGYVQENGPARPVAPYPRPSSKL